LFNTDDTAVENVFDLLCLDRGETSVSLRDLWQRKELGPVRGSIRQALAPHSSMLLRVAA